MKNKIQLLQFVAILIFSFGAYAQVTISVSNLQYTNNGQSTITLANCGNIDLASSTTTSINLGINLSKPNGQVVGLSDLRVYTKKSSSDSRIERSWVQISEASWNTSVQPNTCSTSASFSINSSDFNASGGTLFVVFKSSGNIEYTSTCVFTITKALIPSFTLSPTSLILACGDTAEKTFTVSASNIPNGANLSYSWGFTGWNEINRTFNTITLSPASGALLPGNVMVFPTVNGVAYPSKTCTVSRPEFTSTASISGSASICSPTTSSSYSITNLGTGNTVTWSSSDTTVATVSSTTGNTITVNKVSDGTFNLIARITNSCGQYVDVPKTVRFGGAPVFAVLSGWIPQQPYISRISMVSIDPNIPLSAEGITATTWIEKLANGSTRDCKTGTGLFTATVLYDSQYVTVTATNSCGTSTQVIDIIDLFGLGLEFRQNNTESTQEIIKTFPNPATDIINIELENTELSTKSNIIEAQLYDMMGQFREKVEFTNNKATFNVRDYPKGLYFLKVNIDGKIETKQIIVE